MKKIKLFILGICFPILCSAWNGSGHMTGGAIAYYYLKAHNPSVLAKVISSLKKHPWYSLPAWHDKLAGLTTEQQNVALFMLASTYPDDAKSNYALGGGDKKKWHYINLPIIFPNSNVKSVPPKSPNAQQKISEFLSSIPKETDNATKAVNTSWLFHLIEDIHQPLHAVALIDVSRPDGDKGGGLTYIKIKDNKPILMHTYWDGLIKGSFNNIPANAQQLLSLPSYSENSLGELKSNPYLNDWLSKESYSLAKAYCYSNGLVTGTLDKPSIVDESYIQNSKAIGQKRIVLAGIRLAKSLIAIYK